MILSNPRIVSLTPRWLVADKPAGWLVIPGRDSGEATPVLRDWAREESGGEIFVVHRIDRETSGLVLFARDAGSHREANEWFARHSARKTYDFLAQRGLSAPILRVADPVGGAPSVTQVEIRERFGAAAFLGRARPLTGRRHQIRIHLASRGCPLLGDRVYGGPREIMVAEGRSIEIGRTMLHAARLELPTGEAFEAPWPEDFGSLADRLRQEVRT